MADKGFNLFAECAARRINFIVPPGKCGTSQMTPTEVKKTISIAKLRILVEQKSGLSVPWSVKYTSTRIFRGAKKFFQSPR